MTRSNMSDNYAGNRGVGALAEGRLGTVVASAATAAMNLGNSSLFQRVVVEEVIFDPSLIDEDRAKYYETEYKLKDISFLRSLPPNTIIGRHVRDGSTTGGEEPQYFFPMLPPHFMLPVKAGEHVWVFYEENKTNHYGYWLFRITEPRSVDDLNQTHADRKFHLDQKKGARDKFENASNDETPGFDNGPTLKSGGEKKLDTAGASYGGPGGEKAYEKLIKESDAGKTHDLEDVPRFKKRPGDLALQGSNNTMIVLGTDRTGAVAESETSKTGKRAKGKPTKDKKGKSGSIDIVVGRGQGDKTKPKKVAKNALGKDEVIKNVEKENPNEGDPDFETDLGRIYLSMKTDPDKNFNVKMKGIKPTEASDGIPAAVIKVDHVRIIARKTIKFLVQPSFEASESECAGIVIKDNGEIVLIPADTQVLKLGGDDADKAVLCTSVNNKGAGGTVVASPIMDTMAGVQGAADGLNGTFARKVLLK